MLEHRPPPAPAAAPRSETQPGLGCGLQGAETLLQKALPETGFLITGKRRDNWNEITQRLGSLPLISGLWWTSQVLVWVPDLPARLPEASAVPPQSRASGHTRSAVRPEPRPPLGDTARLAEHGALRTCELRVSPTHAENKEKWPGNPEAASPLWTPKTTSSLLSSSPGEPL